MSHRGLCSRREADRFIERGMVYVDGKRIITLGTKVLPSQSITLDETALHNQKYLSTLLLNKPMNYVSGLPDKGYQSAMMLLNNTNRQYSNEKSPSRKGLAPAGRLDINSMGLMVFTQDGRIAKQLIGPENCIEKEYLVKVKGDITEEKLHLLCRGLSLDGKMLKEAKVEYLKGHQLRFLLKEGRNRQIRRMCELVELKVARLVRVRIGNIRLGNLQLGKWRLLKLGEKF